MATKAPATKRNIVKAAPATRATVKKDSSTKAMTKRAAKSAPPQPVRTAAPKAEPLTHRLDALLHTMRTIAQHEDELCSLLHDARRTGRITKALMSELKVILAALPAEEYTDDLHAVLTIADAA